MKTRRKRVKPPGGRKGWARCTIVLPEEVFKFASSRAESAEHAGNFSGFIRTLIIRDAKEREQKRAA